MPEKPSVNILLLDDDPFILKLLARMLENLGFTSVSLCESGHAALAQLDREGGVPDVILMDINMPEMDGMEFLRKLAEHRYAGSIALISGEEDRVVRTTETLVHTYKIPLLGRLLKPVTPAELAAVLDKWPPLLPEIAEPPRRKSYGFDALRSAIVNDELVVHYQPKVAIATGRVIGMEALVRWQHPTEGLLLPQEFIGEMAKHGLIGDLTREVLATAVAQAKIWHAEGRLLQISINVSAQDLTSLDFADVVAGLVGEAGISPQGILLELAESHLMRSSPALLETLTRLRLKRFRLSLDDFGSVHSTLAQLRNIPFDELKLTASIVHGAQAHDPAGEKYDASLRLARQLDVQIVGKGVEDLDDWDHLRHTGCDMAQGYFIGMPMPAADLPGWMKQWQQRVSGGFRNGSTLSGT